MDTQGNSTSTLLGDDAMPYLHRRGGASDLFEKPLSEVNPIPTRHPKIISSGATSTWTTSSRSSPTSSVSGPLWRACRTTS
jgi:hypothetical protein